jgi:hypothetical protein
MSGAALLREAQTLTPNQATFEPFKITPHPTPGDRQHERRTCRHERLGKAPPVHFATGKPFPFEETATPPRTTIRP